MDDFVQHVLEYQVADQALYLALAGEDLAVAPLWPSHRLWFSIQNLVIAAGNLSKLLWGQAGKLAVEREPLRRRFGVEEDSVLRPTQIRNDFEHIDERVQRWATEHPNGNFVDMNVGPLNMIQVG